MIFAKEPYLLHLLAGSSSISALDAAKSLLDSGRHNASECEPEEHLSVLHVAAAWDNLAMCQLLVHYGADIDAVDVDGRRPVDVGMGRSRKFLKKYRKKHRKDRNKISKIFSFVFEHACLEPKNLDASSFSPFKLARRSCPILPSAPTIDELNVPIAKNCDERQPGSSVSQRTSTASYVTAFDVSPRTRATGMQIDNQGRKSSSADIEVKEQEARQRQRTNSSTSGISAMRLGLFSNVTLRRGKKKPLKPEKASNDQLNLMEQRDSEPKSDKQCLRSSLSCSAMDNDYLSSDHTTPRHSKDDLLEHRDKASRRLSNARKFSSSSCSRRLKSFGPQNDFHLYPNILAEVGGLEETKHSFESPNSIDNTITPVKPSSAISIERPYNETLNEVAAGLAAIKIEVSEPDDAEESQIRSELAVLDLEDLRKRLRERKCSFGPICADNRHLYESKLARIELNIRKGGGCDISKYSHALQRVLVDDVKERIGVDGERELRHYFQSPVTSRRKEVACFCYLLIDPSMIADFSQCMFHEFIGAIFYVGKGTGTRPFSHLIDASASRTVITPKINEKVRRILDLWDKGIGVVSLQICQNIHAEEALIRECCIIDAIGIENLTNVRRGKVAGLPTTWSQKRITELGVSILQRAHAIIRNERCRPIMEDEVYTIMPHRNVGKR